MKAMTTRERFQAVTQFQPFDRLPIVEWASWWSETLDRWHQEALPAELTDRYEIARHFGLDLYKQQRVAITRPGLPQPAYHGAGIIEDEAGYEAILPYLYPQGEDLKLDASLEALAAEQARGEAVLWFTVDGFFWFARRLLGIERHLYAFYDQQSLLQRINEDLSAWIETVVEHICQICTPDFMTFAEDMSYNHGPMLSEDLFARFMAPYYRRVVPSLRKHGIRVIVDSDGDISQALPWFEAVGIEGLLPLERQAGVDVAELRRRHPRMLFMGCFDKMTMNKGESAMRAEFERLLPTAASGGLIISCDHQTPPGVSYDDYLLYLELFREYAERAGERSRR